MERLGKRNWRATDQWVNLLLKEFLDKIKMKIPCGGWGWGIGGGGRLSRGETGQSSALSREICD